jgi:hypothetical protein
MSTRAHPLLYVITVLLVLNVIFTTRRGFGPSQSAENASAPVSFELEAAERTALFNRFKELYNARDRNGLYELLDPVIRVQVARADFDTNLDKLYGLFSSVNEGAYSHTNDAGSMDGMPIYQLVYKVRVESELFEQGVLSITVTPEDENCRVIGFRLTST